MNAVKTGLTADQLKMVIGKEYVETAKFAHEEDAFTRKAYKAIAKVNAKLFKLIPYKVVFTDTDHYATAKEMREEVARTGVLKIYSGWSGHPYLTQEQNNQGRAVHDAFAHLVCGCPFSFQGEYNAYLEQRKHYPAWTWAVLFAEIPGQTSAYYYYKETYGEAFGYKQRAFEAPHKWLVMADHLKKDYSRNAMLQWNEKSKTLETLAR